MTLTTRAVSMNTTDLILDESVERSPDKAKTQVTQVTQDTRRRTADGMGHGCHDTMLSCFALRFSDVCRKKAPKKRIHRRHRGPPKAPVMLGSAGSVDQRRCQNPPLQRAARGRPADPERCQRHRIRNEWKAERKAGVAKRKLRLRFVGFS